MTTLKVGIASYNEMKARTMAIRGRRNSLSMAKPK
jgi:predicted transcriptional regulator